MLKSLMFAAVACTASFSFAYDNPGATQWASGCCEHQPLASDHLWDDYCTEQNAPKCRRVSHFGGRGGGAPGGVPSCSRWRPRGGGGGGFRGFSHGSVEAPIYVDGGAPASAPSVAPNHGIGCLCPQCQAAATPAQHGPGCTCPQCQGGTPAPAALAPAPVPSAADVLSPTPVDGGEFHLDSDEPIGTPLETEQELKPALQQQPFQLEGPPTEELPKKKN